MDYEKEYKDALERAREYHKVDKDNTLTIYAKGTMEYLFPVLKESDDERMRKGIISNLDNMIAYIEDSECSPKEKKFIINDIKKQKTWLEKQGDQKSTNDTDEEIVEAVKDTSVLDLVEPKFKVGDWVVDKKSKEVFNISKKLANTYEIIDIEGNDYHVPHYTLEEEYDLWTVQDAKDGDVLACGDKVTGCPFIFHNLTEELNPRSYCGVNTLHHFQDNDENGGYWCSSNEVRPATKEQCDLLFSKMHEAGYEWDVEKKELKKVEQKPTELDEDYDRKISKLKTFIAKCNGLNKGNREIAFSMIDSLKPQPQWKPSDEQMHYLSWIANIKLGESVVEQEVSKRLNELYEDLKKLKG